MDFNVPSTAQGHPRTREREGERQTDTDRDRQTSGVHTG